MHRGDLLDVLLAACRADARIVLEPSRDVVDVEEHGDGVRAVCADGTAYDGIALVAADGLWSRLRKLVHDDGEPRRRALRRVPRHAAGRGAVGRRRARRRHAVDRAGLHFVQYPIRGGQLFNQVAVFRSDRYRPDSDDWGTPDELDARFAVGCAPVQAGIARIRRDRRWTMYDREPIANWSRGRLALLGDAAHPMLQYLAQGACQALEDAVVLADALAAHDDPAGGLPRLPRPRAICARRACSTARACSARSGTWATSARRCATRCSRPAATTTSPTSSGCTAGAREGSAQRSWRTLRQAQGDTDSVQVDR